MSNFYCTLFVLHLFSSKSLILRSTNSDTNEHVQACKQFYVSKSAQLSHGGRLWEYYHFLVDFAPAMYFHLHNHSASCKILNLPGWVTDDKFDLTLKNHPQRSMQVHFDYLLGKPLNLEVKLITSEEDYPLQNKTNHDSFINWDCSPGKMEWAQQPPMYFHFFRHYAQTKPGINPVTDDVVTVKREFLDGYMGPATAATRRKLDDSFYDALMEDMKNHNWHTSVLSLERESMKHQIELFYGAKVVVAQHGAALSNMLFVKPDATVIEVGLRDYLCYETLARKLGLSYLHFNSSMYPDQLGNELTGVGFHRNNHRVKHITNTVSEIHAAHQKASTTSCPSLSSKCFGKRFHEARDYIQPAGVDLQAMKYDVAEFEQAMKGMRESENLPPRIHKGGKNEHVNGHLDTFCVNGHVAPSVFLLGAQKAATTTLAVRLAGSPDIGLGGGKEPHFFDSEKTYTAMGGVKGYLARFPKCDGQTNKFMIGLDATPNYLASHYAVHAIKKMYGKMSEQIQFIILLREPIERLQSEFYHAKSLCKSKADSVWGLNVCNATFNSFVEDGLNHPDAHLDGPGWSYSDYVPALDMWLKEENFSPAQFTIVPMKYITDVDRHTEPFHSHFLKYLGARVPQQTVTKMNSHSHLGVEADLHQDVLTRVQKHFRDINSPQLLAKKLHDRSGATLWGCSECDVDSTAKWIQDNW